MQASTHPPSLGLLLSPRLRVTRRALGAHPRRMVAGLAGLVATLLGTLALFENVLGYFHALGEIGPLLTLRLLELLIVTLAGVTLLSSTIAALSIFYLSDETALLLASPVPLRRIHHARFVETLVASSWMVLVFSVPALLAWGRVHDAHGAFLPLALLALVALLVLLTATGILLASAIVLVLPARGARDGLLIASALLIGAGLLALRLARPERLEGAGDAGGFAAFLLGLGAGPSPWLPTTWTSDLMRALLGADAPAVPLRLGLLVTSAALAVEASASLLGRVLPLAWSRAQSGRGKGGPPGRANHPLDALLRPLPRPLALFFAKDLRLFLRDPAQWSQLLLLAALGAIYVFNFSALPIAETTAVAVLLRDLAQLANLPLAAFVAAALAVRFVFTMPALEARTFWLVRSSPIMLEHVWRAKFTAGYLPLLAVALAMAVGTNVLLDAPASTHIIYGVTLALLLAAIVSLGLAMGATHAPRDGRSVAQVAAGPAAMGYMTASLGLVAAVVALELWPLTRLLAASRAREPLGTGAMLAIAVCFAAAAALCCGVTVAARRGGIRALARLG